MKKPIHKIILLSLLVLTTAMQCNEDNNPITCEQTLQSLQNYKTTIEALAAASICSDQFECRYVAFGSKPCGGPWEYLVYSTSIDTTELVALVSDYNDQEERYNLNCGAVSDCLAVQPPTSFDCVNERCIPLY